jgi:hypothetical protein
LPHDYFIERERGREREREGEWTCLARWVSICADEEKRMSVWKIHIIMDNFDFLFYLV